MAIMWVGPPGSVSSKPPSAMADPFSSTAITVPVGRRTAAWPFT
ncbi:MAG: hypothetical protein WDN49_25175 [Acetobacteraceae bacterium]